MNEKEELIPRCLGVSCKYKDMCKQHTPESLISDHTYFVYSLRRSFDCDFFIPKEDINERNK